MRFLKTWTDKTTPSHDLEHLSMKNSQSVGLQKQKAHVKEEDHTQRIKQ